MISTSLPDPIDLKGFCNSYEEAIYFVYNKYLKDEFFNKDKRAKFKGKFIYVETKKDKLIKRLPERYWHIITFEDGIKYSIDPCLDIEDRKLCKGNKRECNINICTPSYKISLKNRTECMFRLRRVNRINTIIKFANKDDPRIKVWRKNNKKKGKNYNLIFIRYQESVYDHVVILLDFGDMYNFITSYPVCHRKAKKEFDIDYDNYLKNK